MLVDGVSVGELQDVVAGEGDAVGGRVAVQQLQEVVAVVDSAIETERGQTAGLEVASGVVAPLL